MSFLNSFRLAACAVFMAGSVSASTISDKFTSFWVLGDSLSGPVAGTSFVASDGPLWSQRIAKDFTDAGKTAGIAAIAGATAGRDRPIDLITQTVNVIARAAEFGTRPLAAIWIGGNDVGAIGAGQTTFTQTVTNYATSIAGLIGAGVRDFLVFEVPDVSFTPLVKSLPAGNQQAAQEGSILLNAAFFGGTVPGFPPFDGVTNLLPSGVNVTRIDAFALTQIAYETPEFFGVPRRGPCFNSETFTVLDDCSQTAFWDPFHPTAALHRYVTAEVRAAYAPAIPLPAAGWLLIAAMGGLVALRRRA